MIPEERKRHIISLFSRLQNVDYQDALWFFFSSNLLKELEAGASPLAALSDETLAERLQEEFTGAVPYHC